ncbi:hypothetical protein PRUPE_6G139500 [Prunus persica]|uniref:Uncharacterized protein n=1 Tax=Prunus persica TaxID=3760 RepID=A0A251NQ58_PRUPE|nr:hypothetical protein PRUPE_6G139500 [Prunus persica]
MESSNERRRFSWTKFRSQSFPTTNSEVNCPLLEYTSLKDLMPSSTRPQTRSSPKALAMQSAYQIPISNLLVQKAAWAYLQPMPEPKEAVPRFSTMQLFGNLKIFSRSVVTAIRRVFGRLLGAIHIRR